MMKYNLFILAVGADLASIILRLFQEHTYSTNYNQHSVETHGLVRRHTGSAQTHTCASESNVVLVTAALAGVILGFVGKAT